MAEEDAELVALLDNELDEVAKGRLLARLWKDEALRKRYEALREAKAQITASFDALLEMAPLARLRAALPPEGAPRAAPRRFAGIAFRELAAGIVVGLLAATAAAWVALGVAPRGEQEDWRAAVVRYTELYTNETFAFPSPDASLEAEQLSAVGTRVGADLTPESVRLPDLQFKVAIILSYDGSPLGEIAFVDPRGAPVLFCVIANGAADAPMRSKRRGELSLSSWSRGGRGYLVIGRLPDERIADLARTLEKRF
jgi:anti-sigma factor RsiW